MKEQGLDRNISDVIQEDEACFIASSMFNKVGNGDACSIEEERRTVMTDKEKPVLGPERTKKYNENSNGKNPIILDEAPCIRSNGEAFCGKSQTSVEKGPSNQTPKEETRIDGISSHGNTSSEKRMFTNTLRSKFDSSVEAVVKSLYAKKMAARNIEEAISNDVKDCSSDSKGTDAISKQVIEVPDQLPEKEGRFESGNQPSDYGHEELNTTSFETDSNLDEKEATLSTKNKASVVIQSERQGIKINCENVKGNSVNEATCVEEKCSEQADADKSNKTPEKVVQEEKNATLTGGASAEEKAVRPEAKSGTTSETMADEVKVIEQGSVFVKSEVRATSSGICSKSSLPVPLKLPSIGDAQSSEVSLYLTLPHAVQCSEEKCTSRECYIAKRFIAHVSSCYQQSKRGCQICIAMDTMVCRHAKVCKIPLHESCPIPSCNKVKVKVLEQWMRLKVKHSDLMERAFNLLVHSRGCRGECAYGNQCFGMKKLCYHAKKCSKGDNCPNNHLIYSLCLNHKDSCTKDDCTIKYCQDHKGRNVLCRFGDDDENKENVAPHKEIVISDFIGNGKAESCCRSRKIYPVEESVKDAVEGSCASDSKKVISSFPQIDEDVFDNQSTESKLQALSRDQNLLSNSYENFSFFSNVYQPVPQAKSSLHGNATISVNNKRKSESASEQTDPGVITNPCTSTQRSPDHEAKNDNNSKREYLIDGTTDGHILSEKGFSLLKPSSDNALEQSSDLDLCGPLPESDKLSETESKKEDPGYRLYSLWPDPSSTLPTFSPTEIQRILKVSSSNEFTFDPQGTARTETIEDILNLKDADSFPMKGEKIIRAVKDEELGIEVYPRKIKKLETTRVLTTPDSGMPIRSSLKRNCARCLFPPDQSKDK